MERAAYEAKLSQEIGRGIKRVATDEHPAIVRIPDVVRMTIVVVQPPVIVIVFDVEHVQIAVRVGLHGTSSVPPLFEILSELYRIRDL